MHALALFALMLVPLLYGGMYLWANKDPQGSFDKLPVAIVNEDHGATRGDEQLNFGDRVTRELLDGHRFDWHEVSRADADHGVQHGEYNFAVEIPASFSEDLISGSGDNPHVANVSLTTNDANNYLGTSAGQTAANTILETISEQVGHEATLTLLNGISEIRGNLVKAADGSAQLVDGLTTAKDGAGQLRSGLATLDSGVGQLQSGAAQMNDGAAQLSSGASRLDTGLAELDARSQALPDATARLADGAAQVSDGVGQIASVANEVAGASSRLVAGLGDVRERVAADLRARGVSEDVVQAVIARLDAAGDEVRAVDGTVQQKVGQVNQLASGASQVADGAAQLAAQAPQLVGGIGQAHQGSSQLAAGASRLADATEQAVSGIAELKDGSSRLLDGSTTLDDGLGKLHDGASELHDGLAAGVAKLPDSSEELRNKQSEVLAKPVALDQTKVTSAGTYGAGLAPFFSSLAAWIGMYALFLIVRPFSRRAVTALRHPLRVAIAGWLTPALLGVLQMGVLFGILVQVLHLPFAHPWLAFGMLALASGCFAAIIMALKVWLGSVGQFIGLVLMVVQLVTAGGTFPWQTLPAPLAALHPFMPMSWSVDGMRQLMYGGDLSSAASGAILLLLTLIAAVGISAIGIRRMTVHTTMRDLQPSLIE